MSNSVRQLSFPSNGQNLHGHLHMPVGERPRAYALFAHCFTCTANSRAAVHIARALAVEGIAVLRFDFTGLGASDGDFADSNFSSNVDDLVAAANYLADFDRAPELLVGHSLGGTAALAAAARLSSIKAVATLGGAGETGPRRGVVGGRAAHDPKTGRGNREPRRAAFSNQESVSRRSCEPAFAGVASRITPAVVDHARTVGRYRIHRQCQRAIRERAPPEELRQPRQRRSFAEQRRRCALRRSSTGSLGESLFATGQS